MYTTTNENGILNNYAVETPLSYAEFPSEAQQRQYAFQGGVAVLLVSLLVLTAFAVS